MEPMPPEPRGPALFGPPVDPSGLPVLPGLAERLAASAGRGAPEPVGGGPELLDAAGGYWARRGLATGPERLLAAAGPQPLLLALLAAVGGDVFTTRPCAPWHSAQPLVLGRPAYPVPVPAECGGVPDPFALLETVRRVRAEGGTPRVLVLSPADDPTGTTAPPELLHEVCEAAAGEGLLIISDETDRDALHPSPVSVPDTPGTPDAAAPPGDSVPGDPVPAAGHGPGGTRAVRGRPVFVSPAEMLPGHVVVLAGLGTTLLPPGWPAAIARFPAGREGAALRAAALGVLAGTRTGPGAPPAAAVAHALTEPPDVTERLRAAARLHGILAAALYRTVVRHGALCRPPRAGDRVYADLGPFGDALAARGIGDSVELELHLTRRLGFPVAGGHRFGDPPDALRVRFTTEPLLAPDGPGRLRALTAADPLDSPHAARSLTLVTRALDEWSGG